MLLRSQEMGLSKSLDAMDMVGPSRGDNVLGT